MAVLGKHLPATILRNTQQYDHVVETLELVQNSFREQTKKSNGTFLLQINLLVLIVFRGEKVFSLLFKPDFSVTVTHKSHLFVFSIYNL